MKHRYLPATEKDKQEMLATIGVSSIDDLFADIPENVKYKKSIKSKSEIRDRINKRTDKAGL